MTGAFPQILRKVLTVPAERDSGGDKLQVRPIHLPPSIVAGLLRLSDAKAEHEH
jgi:hypothetical protein